MNGILKMEKSLNLKIGTAVFLAGFFCLIGLTLSNAPAMSADRDKAKVRGAEAFVHNVAERGLGFLSDEALSHEARTREFRSLLIDSFDIKTIGRFSLGRYWRKATPDQRKEFIHLFREMIVASYASRFNEYSGQKLIVTTARPEGKKDVIVASKIVSPAGGPDVVVRWRVRENQKSYQVIDVIIEGVSMLVTHRSDFAAVIERGGGDVDVLLSHMRGRNSK